MTFGSKTGKLVISSVCFCSPSNESNHWFVDLICDSAVSQEMQMKTI